MKYFVTMFWALIFGQVIGYISSALSGGTTDFKLMFFLSIFFGIIAIIFTKIAIPEKNTKHH